MMKIIVAGPGHLKTVPMFQQTVATLEVMGHAVTPFNLGWKHPLDKLLRRPLKKALRRDDSFLPAAASGPKLNRKLRDLADALKPDIFFAIFGFDLEEATLTYLQKKGIKTVCWWLNDPFHPDRSYNQAGWYDLYFTNAPGAVPGYRKAGFSHVHGLLHACYPPWHHPVDLAEDERELYECQVALACDWEENREAAALRLVDRYRLKIWGPWKKKLPDDSPLRPCIVADWFTPEEMAKICAGADVVLNMHTWFKKYFMGCNPRVFEACGCGAVQLCDWKEEIPEVYEEGQEIILYKSEDELLEKLDHYLGRPDERHRIRKAAAARSLRDHTYRQRMMTVLERINTC